MLKCPGVDEVGIAGRSDQTWGDLLVALYVGTATQEEMAVWCQENIISSMRPREFIRVSELPRNGMGKLDRDGLRMLVNQA
jgi:O-succinylbenzoic acid--CoA ligase